MTRAPVNPTLLKWSRERAGLKRDELSKKFPKLIEWEMGEKQLTFKQAGDFAKSVHVPVGYLFLSKPPTESIPIPDFRTIAGSAVANPSPDLMDVVEDCEERQDWYRNFAQIEDLDQLPLVSSASQTDAPEKVARQMQETLNFAVEKRQAYKNWGESYRKLIDAADTAGILVMVSGIVGSNTHRKLNPEEFRGFAISDWLAPLVFVNGADTKAAQIFTLAHELAHLWLGASALSNCSLIPQKGLCDDEMWCNAVASEFLVPEESLNRELREDENLTDSLRRLAGVFKVSSLIILRRLLDSGRIDGERFSRAWRDEIDRPQNRSTRVAGGDFYETTLARVNRRFAQALVASTLGGQTLYRDAHRMLAIKKSKSFDELARRMGKIR